MATAKFTACDLKMLAARLAHALGQRLPADPWTIIGVKSAAYTLADYEDANLYLEAIDTIGRKIEEEAHGLNGISREFYVKKIRN
jgi:hypothetical protein